MSCKCNIEYTYHLLTFCINYKFNSVIYQFNNIPYNVYWYIIYIYIHIYVNGAKKVPYSKCGINVYITNKGGNQSINTIKKIKKIYLQPTSKHKLI